MTTRETGWFLLCEFFKVTWVLYASYAGQGREAGSVRKCQQSNVPNTGQGGKLSSERKGWIV